MDNNMNQSGDKMVMGGKVCYCPHHSVVSWCLIVMGVAVLLSAFNILTFMGLYVAVGILLIIIGIVKIGGRKCGCCNNHS